MHLSKEEQRKRFLHCLGDPTKNWKLSLADIEERKFWDGYIDAYEACLCATSTIRCPWYIIPADDKENAALFISQIILDNLKKLKMTYPKPDSKRLKELQSISELLSETQEGTTRNRN